MQRRAARDERLGVRALMVVGRERVRHEDRRLAERGELGERRRAGAADDQVGGGVGRAHVVDERPDVGVEARSQIRAADPFEVGRARLMDDAWHRHPSRPSAPQRVDADLVQAMGARPAAEDQHREALAARLALAATGGRTGLPVRTVRSAGK